MDEAPRQARGEAEPSQEHEALRPGTERAGESRVGCAQYETVPELGPC